MNNELAYYDQPALWGNEPLEYQRTILSDIETLIPTGVESILDAGCGDGFLTDSLPAHLRVVGLDFSEVALSHVRREKVLASISEMPFPNDSFDLVMANDVLEHMPPDAYRSALKEILRISARYVLITVPFLENLAAQTTRCGNCGLLYHINHHYRSFGVMDLFKLLSPQAAPRLVLFTGVPVDPAEEARRHLSASLGVLSQWELAVCPSCGARASLGDANAAEAGVVAALAAGLPKNPYGCSIPDRNEAMVLFEKQPGARDG
ncbi:MAG: class I SAM-dependent methyltransferase, partial [Planctomycetes bacterium]|nr:class I SAM-dependent methyltransferase [Planctomycetota bacterium]